MFEHGLFDSLTHPSPTGGWLDDRSDGSNGFDALLREMDAARVDCALAVGLGPRHDGYDEASYADAVRAASPRFFPVTFFDFERAQEVGDAGKYARTLRDHQYVAVKIHPRLSGVSYLDQQVAASVTAAADAGLPTLLSTYCYARGRPGPVGNELDVVAELLERVNGAPLVPIHGGVLRVLELSGIARAFPNVLLDLSFTLCKCEGSSIDDDLRFLFRRFDRRVCVGSDSPEFSPRTLRRRFDELTEGRDAGRVQRIGHSNLAEYLGLAAS